MKKIIFVSMMMFVMGIVWGVEMTYRIYTGRGQWKVKRIAPDTTAIMNAVNVPPNLSQWEPSSHKKPWGLLYSQDTARWISTDSFGVPPGTGHPAVYRFWSPQFKMYDGISRATLWLAADDSVTSVQLRNCETGDVYDLEHKNLRFRNFRI